MSSTSTCRQVKTAILSLGIPEDVDPEAWCSGLVGSLHGINLHAIRQGIDPYRDPVTVEAED